MSDRSTCVVIGASHAGVNCAFALRKEGWEGEIVLYDADTELPYHRPPLSKTYLTNTTASGAIPLKSRDSYVREQIQLKLGHKVVSLDADEKQIEFEDGSIKRYDTLVLATGARPIFPMIPGLADANAVFPLRTAADVEGIRKVLDGNPKKKVVVIGGGYIGLEIASSLKVLGAEVTVLEREDRVLARVTAPEMSDFFQELHTNNGVEIHTGKKITAVEQKASASGIICSDGSEYTADIIIIGVGIHINKELAEQAILTIENGIKVDATAKTSNDDIYAIGDCSYHHNLHYNRYVRLESVQNAVDQSKIAAAAICGKDVRYDAIPWFWSDQYDIKLQIVGLAEGYDNIIVRKEEKEQPCFSIWYFRGNNLLSVDAINNAKAYVVGTKLIKSSALIAKVKLSNTAVPLKPVNLILDA
ncbi:MAG: FAD/NAD(P)-binding oxidoreductase [Maribacter sp.]|uniref:NAD(P)/FAD-dependent oxidoreductase n=1 Tax=Maribacter sp. TaxID=1897614 RepID=UPI00329A0177